MYTWAVENYCTFSWPLHWWPSTMQHVACMDSAGLCMWLGQCRIYIYTGYSPCNFLSCCILLIILLIPYRFISIWFVNKTYNGTCWCARYTSLLKFLDTMHRCALIMKYPANLYSGWFHCYICGSTMYKCKIHHEQTKEHPHRWYRAWLIFYWVKNEWYTTHANIARLFLNFEMNGTTRVRFW